MIDDGVSRGCGSHSPYRSRLPSATMSGGMRIDGGGIWPSKRCRANTSTTVAPAWACSGRRSVAPPSSADTRGSRERSRWPPQPFSRPGRAGARNGRPRRRCRCRCTGRPPRDAVKQAAGQWIAEPGIVVRLAHVGQRQAQLASRLLESPQLLRVVRNLPAADDHGHRPARGHFREQFGRQPPAAHRVVGHAGQPRGLRDVVAQQGQGHSALADPLPGGRARRDQPGQSTSPSTFSSRSWEIAR